MMLRAGVGPELPLIMPCNYSPPPPVPSVPISRSHLEDEIFYNILTFVSDC